MSRKSAQAQASQVGYELHSLGWKGFQDLCASVAAEVLGQTVQVFLSSKDGGRDGAFHGQWKRSKNETFEGSFTVQCKFTSKKDAPLAATSLDDELKKAQRLATRGLTDTYILMTNHAVSGVVEEQLRIRFLAIEGINHFLVFGKSWIDLKIRESARLRMMVPRVYGLGDLSQILDERAYVQATEILSSLGDDLATFVITDAHRKSVKALAEKGFVLLLGEPAAGKSTIAASLALGAIDVWGCSTIKIRNPEEFVHHWNPHEPKQFFWVDDAFGPTQYQWDLTVAWNNALPHLNAAVRKGARIVFTSRDYIYRSARRDLKENAFPLLVDAQVIINVQSLTRAERQQILYNHIKLGDQPRAFKTKIKPHLATIAQHHEFRPEIARRLGNRFFTRNLNTTQHSILQFVGEPVLFLKDIIRSLDVNSKAAISVIFMNGGAADSPLSLTPTLQHAVEMLGAAPAGVRQAISALDGSLTKLSLSGGQTKWTFKHPTIGDAFAEIVAEDPELLDIYLHGAKVEKLVQEVVCGDVHLANAKVVVPQKRFVMLANRLNLELPIERICTFLGLRCSSAFLKLYFDSCPQVLDYLCSPHSYLQATLQTELIPKLRRYKLLPPTHRHKLIDTVMDLVVTTPDADFLTIERVKRVFTPAERRRFVNAVRGNVIPNLRDIIWDWRTNYDSEQDPEQYFDMLDGALRAYREEFKGDSEALELIVAGLKSIQETIAELSEGYTPPKSKYWEPEGPAMPISPWDRDVFDDVDL
ncbi:MAG TPA: hypothetical protein VK335_22645 [Bryobacteraceae bacterium]|nr:hypothetical protein [Bryobacteraceae bacterium]HZW91914.1 hypothetical protein [Candidatus Eremiobacteraceae bacterium]